MDGFGGAAGFLEGRQQAAKDDLAEANTRYKLGELGRLPGLMALDNAMTRYHMLQGDVLQQGLEDQRGFANMAKGEVAGGGALTHDGFPARQNPDGTYSTEVSITVTDPRLNGGRPTNIPSLWGGKEVDQNTAVQRALESGKTYQSFGSIPEAVTAARARSAAGGAESNTESGDILAPLRRVVARGYQEGRFNAVAPYAKQLFEADAKIATQQAEKAQQRFRELQSHARVIEIGHKLALGVRDQDSYDRMRAALAQAGEDPSDMPERYEDATSLLNSLRYNGVSMLEQVNEEKARVNQESLNALRKAREQQANMAVSEMAARKRLTEARTEVLQRALGPGSQAVVDAKKTGQDLKNAGLIQKLFPPLPAPGKEKEDTIYRNTNGILAWYANGKYHSISLEDALQHTQRTDDLKDDRTGEQ